MTELNMIELIHEDFPGTGETLISHELRKAERDFVSKTYILHDTFEDWADEEDISALDPVFYAIKDIIFTDGDDNVRDSNYGVDNDLVFYIGNSSTSDPLTASGSYYHYPDGAWGSDITTNTPDIPAQFHEALVYHVLKRLAVRAKDNTARIYFSEYKDAVKEGKKYANEEGKRTGLMFEMSMGMRMNK